MYNGGRVMKKTGTMEKREGDGKGKESEEEIMCVIGI